MVNKKTKKRVLTDKEQRVAASILCEYIFTHDNNGYNAEFVKTVMRDYQLHDDPFTHLPCSSKEYAENSLEYAKQTMIERYGHCDGLE